MIGILAFVTVVLTVLGVYTTIYGERLEITRRMQELTSALTRKKQLDDELSKPFTERVIRPVLEKVAAAIGRAMPAKKRVSLQKKLLMAGNPGDLSPNEFLAIQYGITLVLPVAVLLLVAMPMGWGPAGGLAGLGIAAAVGFLLPEYFLKMQAAARQEDIQDSLPDVLDLLTVSVEAGLGFDAALVKVVEKIKGELSTEFGRMLQEVKMGKPRRDALRDLGHRSGVDDVVAFTGAIIQADQLGVSIGNVLRLQSEQMRMKRRQRAEQKAMKAPIKMLIPLILFIFPTIFIVVMGPAAIQLVETFNK
ncbi:type II secretion system F family protein [bacterium]|nr:MAG: type II secretion system F family protein [bacterium]